MNLPQKPYYQDEGFGSSIPFLKKDEQEQKSDKHKTYAYDFTTYLKDSNVQGNNYFSRYFEWQGICREAWFYNCIAQDFLQPLGMFITKQAHNEYEQETFPFQNIRCILNTKDVRRASFYLTFCFCDAIDPSTVFSRGYQQIAFINHAHKMIKLPGDILEKVKAYSI